MQRQISKGHRHLYDLISIALFAALLSLSAWIAIPFGTLPVIMQSFALLCALGMLGGRRGTVAILLYLVLGMIGLPVFSGMTGGFAVLLGPGGGFLFGFLLTGLSVWLFTALFKGRSWAFSLGATLGTILTYLCGVAWFMTVYASGSEHIGILTAISVCVLPYLIPDFCKFLLALYVIRTIKKHISL